MSNKGLLNQPTTTDGEDEQDDLPDQHQPEDQDDEHDATKDKDHVIHEQDDPNIYPERFFKRAAFSFCKKRDNCQPCYKIGKRSSWDVCTKHMHWHERTPDCDYFSYFRPNDFKFLK